MSLFNTETIQIEDLKNLLENHIPVKIIDVRSKENFDQWHIPGSISFPVSKTLNEFNNRNDIISELVFKDDLPVIVVCQEGIMSKETMKGFRDLLDIEAYSLAGGIKHWTRVWNTAEMQSDDTKIIQVRRVGKGCLSYLIINNGEAAVIDAAVEPQTFIDLAQTHQAQIKYVLDTHIHADHFSRSKQLSEQTGSKLLLPAQNLVQYKFTPVKDGNQITIGKAVLKAIHTPGHTDESLSYLLNNQILFSGDLLFLNGVGRPDLKSSDEIARQKTIKLYRSLQKVLNLPEDILVLPGHFHQPVQFDGKLIGKTLKKLKAELDLLNLDELAFIDEILTNMPDTPPNFEQIVNLNITGEAVAYNLVDLEAGENRCSSQM